MISHGFGNTLTARDGEIIRTLTALGGVSTASAIAAELGFASSAHIGYVLHKLKRLHIIAIEKGQGERAHRITLIRTTPPQIAAPTPAVRSNKETVLALFDNGRFMSSYDVTRETKLSVSLVNALLDALLRQRLLIQRGKLYGRA